VAPLLGRRWAESEYTWWLLIGGAGVVTEEQAHAQGEALAIGMGITFYVVRSPEGRLLPAQVPPDNCEVLATIEPPSEQEHTLE
jgi:hypothetical protein